MSLARFAVGAVTPCALRRPPRPRSCTARSKKARDTKVFTIGHREASFPFAYYDDQKKPTGFRGRAVHPDREAVKQELKMPDIQIRYLPVNAQTRIPLLTNGTIDIECGSTTNNLARQQQVDFTYSYYVTGGRLLASKASKIKEVEDLNGKVAGVAPGTSNEVVSRR